MYLIRAIGGALFLAGAFLWAYNMWRTARSGQPVADEEAEAPRLEADTDHGALVAAAMNQPAGRERGNALHALVERWPSLLTIGATIAIAIGGMCEIIPSLIQGALTPKIEGVNPYTPLELAGRDLYIREGCVSCHTQMVRTLRAETERYGEYTHAGECVYDRPFLWGSKRTGPDLAREGVLRPMAAWQYRHLEDPQQVSPGSVMPAYSWLIRNDLDLSDISAKLAALAGAPIFTPYKPKQIIDALSHARAQAQEIGDQLRAQDPTLANVPGLDNKEIIAVIAYLQRLGTDLGKATTVGEGK
jgi:cytochrome c oxidase cbb3-type subunit I/II